MGKAMERAFAEVDKQMARIQFVFICLLFVGFAVMGLLAALWPSEYPATDSLVYEECTFIRYEYGINKSKCRIYVTEYEKPLEITSIVMGRIDEAVLNSIKPGETIRVCTDGEDRVAIFVCAALYEDESILTYEDYLVSHAANDRTRVVLGWSFFAISGLVIAIQSSQYALSGKCDRIYSRFSLDRPTAADIAQEIRQMQKSRKHRGHIDMKKHQVILSLLPIIGSFLYTFYLFLTDREKFPKAFLATIAGMGGFIVVYGGFAAICNITAFDLMAYEWLLYMMLVLSGIVWNIIYFCLLNKLSR